MTSNASKSDDAQRPVPPAPEQLARRLLAYEVGENTNPEELAAAGEQIYLRLRGRLVILLGAAGFDAMWARAMHLAQRMFRAEDDTAAQELVLTGVPSAGGLHAAVHGRAADAAQYNLVLVFASFIGLLFTFIGEDLSLRFIRQIWPNLPPDVAASRAEETTQ